MAKWPKLIHKRGFKVKAEPGSAQDKPTQPPSPTHPPRGTRLPEPEESKTWGGRSLHMQSRGKITVGLFLSIIKIYISLMTDIDNEEAITQNVGGE